jgi:LysM repeat protein
VVQDGDTLFRIAELYNVDPQELMDVNPHIINQAFIWVGDALNIPPCSTLPQRVEVSAACGTDYMIEMGDTLYELASRFKVPMGSLAAINNITNINFIRAGDVLKVPGTCNSTNKLPVAPTSPNRQLAGGCTTKYTIQAGDTLYEVATRFKVPMGTLAKGNNIKDVNMIKAGDVLQVPGACNGTASARRPVSPTSPDKQAAGGCTTKYTINAGDTLSELATRFKVPMASLAAANSIADVNMIKAGDVLKVPGTCNGTQTTPDA